MNEIGLQSEAPPIVVYDAVGIFSAPRVFWELQVMGVRECYVLDGGLPWWLELGYPTESGPVPLERPPQGPKTFTVKPRLEHAVASMSDVVAQSAAIARGDRHAGQIVDARSVERCLGQAPEPREGVRSGAIPGAKCVPYGTVLEAGGTRFIKDREKLARVFESAGINPLDSSGVLTTTCGSGVSAAVLSFALQEILGRPAAETRLYDGVGQNTAGLNPVQRCSCPRCRLCIAADLVLKSLCRAHTHARTHTRNLQSPRHRQADALHAPAPNNSLPLPLRPPPPPPPRTHTPPPSSPHPIPPPTEENVYTGDRGRHGQYEMAYELTSPKRSIV